MLSVNKANDPAKNYKEVFISLGGISSKVYRTEVDPDDRAQSIVTCVNSRGLTFQPFAICWDKGSLPCIA